MVAKSRVEAISHVLNQCKERDIKFVRLWFTDILGFLKSFSITVEELELAMN